MHTCGTLHDNLIIAAAFCTASSVPVTTILRGTPLEIFFNLHPSAHGLDYRLHWSPLSDRLSLATIPFSPKLRHLGQMKTHFRMAASGNLAFLIITASFFLIITLSHIPLREALKLQLQVLNFTFWSF